VPLFQKRVPRFLAQLVEHPVETRTALVQTQEKRPGCVDQNLGHRPKSGIMMDICMGTIHILFQYYTAKDAVLTVNQAPQVG
jgi:hypothetical protein